MAALSHRRRLPARWLLVLASALFLVHGPSADAYCVANTSRWTTSSWTLGVQPGVPSSWATSINNSRLQWDDSRVNLFPPGGSTLSYNYPVFNASSVYAWKMYYSNFVSLGLPNNVPGATIQVNTSNHSTSTMYYNSNWTWNFSGTLNQSQMQADVHTVVMHEMGHSSGLNHPTVCGSPTSIEVASAMHPNYVKKWAINTDDANGIISRY